MTWDYDDFDPIEEFPDEFDEDALKTYQCSKCKAEKEAEFFPKKKDGTPNARLCILCKNHKRKRKRQDFKVECINYKGGQCLTCRYKRCIDALEFHHLDPLSKDFEISKVTHTDLERVKDELDKCILVCANCHREIHAGARIPGVPVHD